MSSTNHNSFSDKKPEQSNPPPPLQYLLEANNSQKMAEGKGGLAGSSVLSSQNSLKLMQVDQGQGGGGDPDPSKSRGTLRPFNIQDKEDEDIEMWESEKEEEEEEKEVLMIVRPLKQIQEEYQKFLQLKSSQKGGNSSASATTQQDSTASLGGSLTNPGTEVFAVDLKWIEKWKALAAAPAAGGSGSTSSAGAGNNSTLTGGISGRHNQMNKNNNILSQTQIEDPSSRIQASISDVSLDYLTNERIVVPKSTMLCCQDDKSPYNNILREEMQAGKDFQLVSRDQWNHIVQNYTSARLPVHHIRRFYEKLGMGIRTFPDVTYHKFEVSFIFLGGPDGPQQTHLHNVYFSKKKTWFDLKNRLVKILKDKEGELGLPYLSARGGSQVSRLWSCPVSQLEVIKSKLDSNEKIKVKGYCLDSLINHPIEQIICGQQKAENNNSKAGLGDEDVPDRDIIIVEMISSDNQTSQQQFRLLAEDGGVDGNPEILAQCQFCFKIKHLNIHCKCMSVSYCSQQCQQNDLKFHQEKCNATENIEDWDLICVKSEGARLGLTGLKNLKNSCYMSSSIQCLSHAIGLTNYFLQGHFKDELNYKNPLGAKGQLAIAYGKLLKQLWYDDQPFLSPWQFKKTIGRFASNFNNFDQQDSQELLNFMLDGLHEDLNRVQQKPIVPQIESEGLDDEKDSEDSWQNHLKRNQSIIVDLMHGQFKSTVKCPDCEKVSIIFDPFMSVSLPIPEIKIVEKQYYWVPYDTSKKCIQDSFKFKSLEQIKTLRKYIAASFDVHQEQFELVVIQDDAVRRILPRYEQISSLNVNNIFIFAMETAPQGFQIQPSGGGVRPPPLIKNAQNSSSVDQGFQINSCSSNNLNDQWNEKKGANELSKKLKPSYIQVITNFSVVQNPSSSSLGSIDESDPERFFPRMIYLRLDESLIQAHIDIFEFFKPLFTMYIEHKEGLSSNLSKSFKKRKQIPLPDRVKASLWNSANGMTLSQQYEAVFGPLDPSRRKLEELPYTISVVSRTDATVDRNKCVFCHRDQCSNCPLPFDDRLTLREYLNMHGVSTQSYFYYEDQQHKSLVANSNKIDKKKQQPHTPSKKLHANLEFELQVQFNAQKCWGLYENLVRSKNYVKAFPEKALERQSKNMQSENDKVTIDDCFRQFMIPEKLSHQNTWFCSRCKMHKQAVKKFQVFKTPPILIINLKRFKGMQQKQNTLVHFPIEGLDMSNFVISQKQKETEPLIYDLFGVSNHYGQLLAGHYTAYAKNEGSWYRFNDDDVEDIENSSQIVSNAAYNLFYARRDIDFNNLNYCQKQQQPLIPSVPQVQMAEPAVQDEQEAPIQQRPSSHHWHHLEREDSKVSRERRRKRSLDKKSKKNNDTQQQARRSRSRSMNSNNFNDSSDSISWYESRRGSEESDEPSPKTTCCNQVIIS